MIIKVYKSNLEGLLQRHVEMAAEIKNLDTDLQMLVYENYNKFISATDTIKRYIQFRSLFLYCFVVWKLKIHMVLAFAFFMLLILFRVCVVWKNHCILILSNRMKSNISGMETNMEQLLDKVTVSFILLSSIHFDFGVIRRLRVQSLPQQNTNNTIY